MARSKLHGMSRLRRKLHHMPEEIRAEVRPAIADGANRIHTEAAWRAPRDEGDLAADLVQRVSKDGLSALVGYTSRKSGFVRQWKRSGWRAHFAEFGTRGAFKSRGRRGQAAQPFLRPAFRSQLTYILDQIDAAVNRALRKAGTWRGGGGA